MSFLGPNWENDHLSTLRSNTAILIMIAQVF
jgi:hypothetical protein